MESEHKGKKLPYEPPKIYELDVDLTQAMGQTRCLTGRQAAAGCGTGNQAQSPGCDVGNSATTSCVGGNGFVMG